MSDPHLVNVVTWAVMNGFRHFRRLNITACSLAAKSRIPKFDFIAVLPAVASLSVHTVQTDTSFPLGVTFKNYAEPLPWWNDLNWGTFAQIMHLAKTKLTTEGGVASYVNLRAPSDNSMALAQHCIALQKSPEYAEMSAKVLTTCRGKTADELNDAFLRCYLLVKLYGVPLWSSSGVGHRFFAESQFVRSSKAHGDVVALLPIFDFAGHSATPNATVGQPDDDMVQWLRQERDLPQSDHLFVLQALRDVEPGEEITVDRNINYNFDPDAFRAWFGFPYR
jgi:hypothetical protein